LTASGDPAHQRDRFGFPTDVAHRTHKEARAMPGLPSDFEEDARDIAALLCDGAHLVGHSYCAIGALYAAALRPQAVRSLMVAKLRGLDIAASGIEASGGYERGVVRALLAAGMSVRQINPFKLRQFAKACGVLAKNDRLDARMIALFVATMPTRSAQRYEAVERLAEIVTARRQLSDDKVAAENASRLFEDATLRRLYRARIARLAADITLLDKSLAEIVASDAVLAQRYECWSRCPA